MTGTASFQALRATLPPAKARLALRFVFQGLALAPEEFAARGHTLTRGEAEFLVRWQAEGMGSRVLERVASGDGSVRMVVGLADGERVESVAMPVGAVCVSSQVGCAVRCRFCASGLDGVKRNLEAQEILEQVVHARREMRIDRVVFMGMGEPTHNLENVLAAVAALKHEALISPTRQTLSTVGSVRAFARMAEAEVRPCLAFSLHCADEARRRELLPHAGRDPLPELVAAADAYGRRMGVPVQWEWTLLEGVNDSDQDVAQLCALLGGTRGYVNLILWNPVAGLPFARPRQERAVQMVREIKRRGILATIRNSTGGDVEAACGQLRRRARPEGRSVGSAHGGG